MQDKFRYLNIGLGVILAFVGFKMLAAVFFDLHPPTWLSLAVILAILSVTMIASVVADRRRPGRPDGSGEAEAPRPGAEQPRESESPPVD
ncbi:MAG: tellurium resistance protein TerC, partial [Acidimicrobiales bacterium]